MKARKKVVSVALSGAMVLGMVPTAVMTALAEEPAATTGYTLTIPSKLDVANSGWNATDGIKASGSLESGKKLAVKADSGDDGFALVFGENSVGYTLAAEDGGAETTSWEFSADEVGAEGGTTRPMGAIVDDYADKPAGTYRDSVTFTASVEDAAPTAILADAFENGSTTVVRMRCFGLVEAGVTIVNNNGSYSASPTHSTSPFVRSIAQDGDRLVLKVGWTDTDWAEVTITLDKSDDTYSVSDPDWYFEVGDLTSVSVNGVEIKDQLTKK